MRAWDIEIVTEGHKDAVAKLVCYALKVVAHVPGAGAHALPAVKAVYGDLPTSNAALGGKGWEMKECACIPDGLKR